MIPLAIRLRNFMCYRDNVPPLSFEGMKLVCLCGDNGSGKSALLDAMTWALWGKARGRTNDEMVHMGQTDMEVDFEFAVGELGYRVVRKHSKSRLNRPGYGSLDFQMRNNDGYVSISGVTIHETEASIKKILRTDYDTFINSAYLVQGRADEFTQKRPAERKEILADILGLSLYDSYEERAKVARKDRETKGKDLEREINSKNKKLEEMNSCRVEFDRVESEVAELGRQIAALDSEITILEKRKGELEVKKGKSEELNKGLAELERELAKGWAQVQEHAGKVKNFEKALTQEAEVENGYGEWLGLTQEIEQWNEKLAADSGLAAEIGRVKMQIGNARSSLEGEQKVLSQEIAGVQKTVDGLPGVLESRKAILDALESLSRQGEELDRKRQQATEAEAEVKALAAASLALASEIKGLKEKLEMLERDTDMVRCPLCETELGLEGKSRLDRNYQRQIQEKAEAHRRNQEDLAEKRKMQQSLRNEVATGEQKLKAATSQEQKELDAINGKIHAAGQAAQQLANKGARKSALDGILAAGNFALTEQKLLGELSEKHRAIGYDQVRHAAAKVSLNSCSKYKDLKKALDEARASLSWEKDLLSRTEDLIAEKTTVREEKIKSLSFLEQELSELPGVTGKWLENKESLAILLRLKDAAGKKSGELKGKLDSLKQLEKEKQRNEIDRQRLSEEEKIYGDLALYFGKKGIQAMLIETAIPEIEEEANLLLSRLTENRLSLKIETQKAKRTGGSVEETLEIKIADELGTRDYALFSGGEAFRINFALRLALSRLLARRAGAPLPTLIIDEGFGTQDREGRERLVEAIGSIKDDFEKIIVITHIEELKEAFPLRIEVTKGPEGSTFTVN